MTPLILLVGFLGAGKTSLLRGLVPLLRERGVRPSIVLNDYQNARVDTALFRELEAAVTPISGSCVCCGSRQELLDVLDRYEHRGRGLLLVETNGTTDAEELVTLLAADPRLHDFSLPFQISVVDVKRWQKRFWHNGLEGDQLRTASVIYFAHTDEVDEGRLAAVLESLALKKAPLPGLTQEELADELARLVEENLRQAVREPCGEGSACGHQHREESGHDPGHLHSEARHHFAAMEILLPRVVGRERFETALKSLPEEILRVKGLVRFEEEPESLHIFQKIGKFDAVQTASLEGEPVTDQPVAVFIGARIDAEFPENFMRQIS